MTPSDRQLETRIAAIVLALIILSSLFACKHVLPRYPSCDFEASADGIRSPEVAPLAEPDGTR